jgi:hypothetical protein
MVRAVARFQRRSVAETVMDRVVRIDPRDLERAHRGGSDRGIGG